MKDLHINCPECGADIEIAEQLTQPLLDAERERIAHEAREKLRQSLEKERRAFTQEMAEKDARLKQAEVAELEALAAKRAAEEEKRNVQLAVQRQVEAEKRKFAEQATADLVHQLKQLQQEKSEQAEQLQKAMQAEIEARKAKAEAEKAKRQVEIEVARKLDDERNRLRTETLREADETHRLKLAEKENQLEGMRKQIEELRRRGESGSQQLQGDVQEVDLKEVLQQSFPGDTFERIATGQRGGDVLQTVIGPGGMKCGSILWESKRTKAWSDGWLSKLRTDQREARADIAAIVTQSLPEGVEQFQCIETVWVSSLSSSRPMAMALRQGLIETAMARQALAGANTKKDVVYNYLTGQEFRQRIGGLVETYMELREGLDKEKRSYGRIWNAREKQLERMMMSMSGLYGDLQGIVGSNLPEVDGLELDATTLPGNKKALKAVGSDTADIFCEED